MHLEINEQEREFLEMLCIRSMILLKKNFTKLNNLSGLEKNEKSVEDLFERIRNLKERHALERINEEWTEVKSNGKRRKGTNWLGLDGNV